MKWTLAGLSFCFASLCFAAFSERILYREGSELFFDIAKHAQVRPHDRNLYRYSDVLLQVPAVALIRMSEGYGGNWLWWSHVMGGLMFYLHPFFFLALSLYLLPPQFRKLWFFPVAAFAFAILPSLGFGVANVSLPASAFWPALILIFRDDSRTSHWLLYLGLLAILSFGHETMVLLPFVLTAACFIFQPKNFLRYFVPAWASLLWTSFAIGHALTRKEKTAFENGVPHVNDLASGLEHVLAGGVQVYFAAFALVIFGIISVATLWRRKPLVGVSVNILILGSVTSFLWILFREFSTGKSLWYSFNYRVLVAAVSSLLAALMIAQLKTKFVFTGQKMGRAMCTVLLVSALFDFRATVEWTKLSSGIRKRIQEMDHGCLALSGEEIESNYSNYFPHVIVSSIVLQNSSRPSKVLGAGATAPIRYVSFCDFLKAGLFTYSDSVEKVAGIPFMSFDLFQKNK